MLALQEQQFWWQTRFQLREPAPDCKPDLPRGMQRDADFYRWLLGGTKVLFTVTFGGFLRYFAGVEIF